MSSSRRDFLLLGSLAGASLLLRCKRAEPGAPRASGEVERLNFWLAIHPDGAVELRATKLEMGQGIWTTLAVIAAEELEVEPSSVRLVVPSTEEVRRAPAAEKIERQDKLLDTGSSVSLVRSWLPVRTAAAAAREMLVAAAAGAWGVAPSECRAEGGRLLHAASGRSGGYGEVAAAAARLPVPDAPRLKEPSEVRFVGRATRRLEGPEIVAGRCRFSSDARQPGQRFAALARPPALGARALAVDDAAARATPGVIDVVALDERGVAVVGDSTWAALAGRERLKISWDEGTAPELSSDSFGRMLEKALDAPDAPESPAAEPEPDEGEDGGERAPAGRKRARDVVAHTVVARDSRLEWSASGARRAEYATSFLAHAPMEPPNALALWQESGRCEIWCGTQYPHRTRDRIARRYRLQPASVVVHPQRMGGSFGRKEADDFVVETVEIARRMPGVPVQLFWSRADDLGHDLFHTATRHRLAAKLDARGRITAWRHRVAAPSPERQWKIMRKSDVIRKAETTQAWNLHYRADQLAVEYVETPCPLQLGFWRGVEAVPNVFVVESFIDELAHAARRDPIEFRLAHLAETVSTPHHDIPFALSRLATCFELAAKRASWGAKLAKGRGRGVASVVFGGRSCCVTIAEVAVAPGGYRVERVVCAADCGLVVNPLGLEGQVESAVVWGLSALGAEITFEKGRARESSHLDYPIPRLPEMPAVEVVVAPSAETPTGIGEIPVPSIAPAVANALFAATGRRLRRLPLRLEEAS